MTVGAVVEIGSQLDVRTVEVERAVLLAAAQDCTGDLVVDLSRLESIDATGLGMLTAVHLRCERAGFRLLLRNCPRDIRRVLAVTRLNRVLHVEREMAPVPA